MNLGWWLVALAVAGVSTGIELMIRYSGLHVRWYKSTWSKGFIGVNLISVALFLFLLARAGAWRPSGLGAVLAGVVVAEVAGLSSVRAGTAAERLQPTWSAEDLQPALQGGHLHPVVSRLQYLLGFIIRMADETTQDLHFESIKERADLLLGRGFDPENVLTQFQDALRNLGELDAGKLAEFSKVAEQVNATQLGTSPRAALLITRSIQFWGEPVTVRALSYIGSRGPNTP